MKMILAMTKLIIEWENVRILALIRSLKSKMTAKKWETRGYEEYSRAGYFSEKTKETGKQTNISNFCLQQTILGTVILDLSEN